MKGTDKRLVLAVSNSVCHWWASPDLHSPNYYLYSGLFHRESWLCMGMASASWALIEDYPQL